jgi:RND family efflux transporter MFP subunit
MKISHNSSRGSMTMPWKTLRPAAAVMLLAIGVSACNPQAAPQKPKAERPVMVQTAKYENRTQARSFAGTIRPRIETDQGFRVAGKVEKRLVQVGDKVVAGQTLATLDSTDLQLQKEQAAAELQAAKGNLANAAADEKRQSTLKQEGWSSTAAFDKSRAAADEARGRLAKAERALALAENALGYAVLKSDSAGVVTSTTIDPGQVVSAGQPAIRIAQLTDKEAVVSIPESLVDRVKGSSASVSLWSEPEKTHKAVLREFSPSADSATRTYLARFTILDGAQDMELGMTATVSLTEAGGERIVRLPLSALFSQGGGASVWQVDPGNGALVLKPVEVVAYEGRDVLIRSGIQDGDVIVTLGVQKLDSGQKVRVVASQN